MPLSFGSPLDLKLIELVRENPLLYDTSHPKYKDCDTREVTWQKIGDALHRPARRCKLRWINIRDMLKKKIKARLRYPEQHLKKYRYEKALSFMLPFYRDDNTSNDYYTDLFEDNPEVEMPPEVFEGTLNFEEEEEIKPMLKVPKRKCDLSSAREFDASSSCREFNTADPVDVFLLTVGSTLRKFTPYYLNQAKSKIFQIVQDYELEQLMSKNIQGSENFGKRDTK